MKKAIVILIVAAGIGFLAWRIFYKGEFLYAGTVEATEVNLSPQVAGVISTVTVEEGDVVKVRQPLVTIGGEDYKLAAKLAEQDFERGKKLHASGSMPDDAFERLRFKRDDAALRVSWCEIQSPLNGVVLDRYHEPGELVDPGMKLLTIADLDEVWAYVYVPQPLLSKLMVNMTVDGFIPEMSMKKIPGRISQIRDEAEFTPKNVQTREERTRLVYGIKISFKNSDRFLKPGMTVEVRLPK